MSDLAPDGATSAANISPAMREDCRALKNAADDLANTRTIDTEDRSTALAAAHRLVRLLDNAGVADAAQHAREVVQTLHHPGLPQPERLQEQVTALAHLLFSDEQR